MSDSEDTRPVSVAELLARNGTIGSPPMGGHRRRKRRDGVSVAELTGEIPVYRTGEIPIISDDDVFYDDDEDADEDAEDDDEDEDDVYEETVYADADENSAVETGVVYADALSTDAVNTDAVYADSDDAYAEPVTVAYTESVIDEEPVTVTYEEPVAYAEPVTIEEPVTVIDEEPVTVTYEEPVAYAEPVTYAEPVAYEEPVTYEEPAAPAAVIEETSDSTASVVEAEPSSRLEAHPLSSNPIPGTNRGPVRGYDPRPLRRSSGAEQMAYDPVDESVDLAELVEEHGGEELRSYLRASSGTLFSGETVADDLARRGLSADAEDYADRGEYGDQVAEQDDYAVHEHHDDDNAVAVPAGGRPREVANRLWNGLVALGQSLLAVVFGAGLFIAFDQLWRWNHLVALVLTVLVVLALAAGVRVVRKTEDIVSTLTAVAVGLLVTLGPLALQST